MLVVNRNDDKLAFGNCSAAVAQYGPVPFNVDHPAYSPHLDADGDGQTCEPYRGN